MQFQGEQSGAQLAWTPTRRQRLRQQTTTGNTEDTIRLPNTTTIMMCTTTTTIATKTTKKTPNEQPPPYDARSREGGAADLGRPVLPEHETEPGRVHGGLC